MGISVPVCGRVAAGAATGGLVGVEVGVSLWETHVILIHEYKKHT